MAFFANHMFWGRWNRLFREFERIFCSCPRKSQRNDENVPLSRSCLLANTRSRLSFISRSLMMRCNSCFASSMRAASDESTTKMRPWVPAVDFQHLDSTHEFGSFVSSKLCDCFALPFACFTTKNGLVRSGQVRFHLPLK